MKHEIVIRGLDNIGQAAEQFLTETAGHTIIAFYAPMGAGKTTFTTALCHRLGVSEDAVSSPTFSIVNEYRTSGGDSIYHFDFYRITRVEEAFDIGLYDYLDSGSLCFIESDHYSLAGRIQSHQLGGLTSALTPVMYPLIGMISGLLSI